jgi:hypothetical protein
MSYMRSGYERDGSDPNRRVKLLLSMLTTLHGVFATTFAAKQIRSESAWENNTFLVYVCM